MNQAQIFEDRSGKRKSILRVGATAAFLVAAVLATIFTLSLGVATLHEPVRIFRQLAQNQLDRDRRAADFRLHRLKEALAHKKSSVKHAGAPKLPVRSMVEAYYAPWESAGLSSFRAHASELTHLAPAWFHLNKAGDSLDLTDFDQSLNPNNKVVLDIARQKGVRVTPLVSNAVDSTFSRTRASAFLKTPAARKAVLNQLIELAQSNGFQGYQFDFEELDDSDCRLMSGFLEEAEPAFSKAGLELSLAAQISFPPEELERWADTVDYLVLMTYDEHSESDSSGPIASLPWFEDQVDRALKVLPNEKVVLGIGSYAYDWRKGKPGAESMSFQEAMATAAGYRDAEPVSSVISLDPESLNSHFTYDDDRRQPHEVWMLDAASAFNQWLIARDRKVLGAAVWALGTEDPQIWTFLDRRKVDKAPNPHSIEKISYPFEVTYVGRGEILKVESRPASGLRHVTVDPDSGMIDSVSYSSYPTTYVVRKFGNKKNKIALTFDDGPDPAWTPQILDALKRKQAPAAFFVVGQNVESNPLLTERIAREGHEIGSHTFTHPNLGLVDQRRTDLELAATKRVIESTTGRSTNLFRPPYNADSQPETADEVRPVDRADQLGYLTVGENIDPNDWEPLIADGKGGKRQRTGDDIVRLVREDLAKRRATGEEGNVVLLHDAGGTRAATVDAVPKLIDALREDGYEIVPLATLLDTTKDALMPPIPPQERAIVGVDRAVFATGFTVQAILFYGFIVALVLGAGRVLLITPLALVQAWRSKTGATQPAGGQLSTVSVLIAAYNESRTIAGTVRSILASDHNLTEVIVIDDGSTDETSQVVESEFKSDPRVRLIRKENGGKASALNLGVKEARGDLLFCVDADTRVEPNAVALMAAKFSDDRVAAVAGNVEVGNLVNVLTTWQSIEYRTSQNLERRAYESLNAITVVPGAIGMWRKSAVVQVGGYSSDTLAEDMDLTWRLRRQGHRAVTEPRAVAWTEAPETWQALFKQRFRWAFGTIQCLWKHRRAVGRHGWFGLLILPSMILFQIVFQVLGPFVDLQLLFTFILGIAPILLHGSREVQSVFMAGPFVLALQLYAMFFLLEFGSGLIACAMDRRKPWPLMWLLVQRFAYRQLMYLVMLKSILRAVTGSRQGWGKLRRTGNAMQSPT